MRYVVLKDAAMMRSGMLSVPPLGKGRQTRSLKLGNLAPGDYELRIESRSLGVRRERRTVVAGKAAEWKLEIK